MNPTYYSVFFPYFQAYSEVLGGFCPVKLGCLIRVISYCTSNYQTQQISLDFADKFESPLFSSSCLLGQLQQQVSAPLEELTNLKGDAF